MLLIHAFLILDCSHSTVASRAVTGRRFEIPHFNGNENDSESERRANGKREKNLKKKKGHFFFSYRPVTNN